MLMTLNVAVLLFRPKTPTPLTVSVVGFTEVKLSHSKELRGLHFAPNIHRGRSRPSADRNVKYCTCTHIWKLLKNHANKYQ